MTSMETVHRAQPRPANVPVVEHSIWSSPAVSFETQQPRSGLPSPRGVAPPPRRRSRTQPGCAADAQGRHRRPGQGTQAFVPGAGTNAAGSKSHVDMVAAVFRTRFAGPDADPRRCRHGVGRGPWTNSQSRSPKPGG